MTANITSNAMAKRFAITLNDTAKARGVSPLVKLL
jgi:hypothetical protein